MLSVQVYITLSIQRLFGIELCRAGHILPHGRVFGIRRIRIPTTQEIGRSQIRVRLNGGVDNLCDPVDQGGFATFDHCAFDQRASEQEELIRRLGARHIQCRRIVAV